MAINRRPLPITGSHLPPASSSPIAIFLLHTAAINNLASAVGSKNLPEPLLTSQLRVEPSSGSPSSPAAADSCPTHRRAAPPDELLLLSSSPLDRQHHATSSGETLTAAAARHGLLLPGAAPSVGFGFEQPLLGLCPCRCSFDGKRTTSRPKLSSFTHFHYLAFCRVLRLWLLGSLNEGDQN